MTTAFTRRTVLGAVPALSLAAPAFAQAHSPTHRATVPIESDFTETLDAWLDRYGRPTAKVMLNGRGPYSFMVDSGATTTVVAERHVAGLGLPSLGMGPVSGTTGTADVPFAQLAKLETGISVKENVRVAILPDAALQRADGVLGANIFAGQRLLFDIQRKLVRVEGSKSSKRLNSRSSKIFLRDGLLAQIEGRVGSVRAKLMLDTGAHNCIVNLPLSEALRKVHPGLKRAEGVEVFGITGHMMAGEFIALPRVSMNALDVAGVVGVGLDAPIFKRWRLDSEPAMIVGVNLLSRLDSFSIDYGSKMFDATLLSDLVARNAIEFG